MNQELVDLRILISSGGRDPPALLHRGFSTRRRRTTTVDQDEELSPELKEFIDRLIVPLLVEYLVTKNGHLYNPTRSRYDDADPLAEAA